MHYRGVCSEKGKFVEEADAFEYALQETRNSKKEQTDFLRCFGEEFNQSALADEEFKQEFVEWFFSGNWIREGCN